MNTSSERPRNLQARKSKTFLAISAVGIVGFMGTAMANDTGEMVRMLLQERGAAWDSAPSEAPPPPPAPSLTIRQYSQDGLRSEERGWRGRRHSPRSADHNKGPVHAVRTAVRHDTDHHAGPPAPPSSPLEDETLRPGDAVMAENGLWIFEGSHSFPYRASDFRALASARSLSAEDRSRLTPYNQVPLGTAAVARLDRRDGPLFASAKPRTVAAADEHGLTIYRQR
jgi:hypothetical protein